MGESSEGSIISRLISRTVGRVKSLRDAKKLDDQSVPRVSRLASHRDFPAGESAPFPTAEPSSPIVMPSAQQSNALFSDHLELACQIGHGCFGSVFEAVYCGRQVAVKRITPNPSFCTREIPILEMIRDNPNAAVVGYYGHYEAEVDGNTVVHLIMDRLSMNLGTYAHMHFEQGVPIPVDAAVLCLHEILCGIAHLHAMRVCHRDLKPDNILLDPATNTVKICDFGSAKCLEGPVAGITYICSRPYRAPELVLDNSAYSFSIDVWSIGCIFAELLLGAPLFRGKNNVDMFVLMVKTLGQPSVDELRSLNPSKPPSLDSTASMLQHSTPSSITGQPKSDSGGGGKPTWSGRLQRPLPTECWPARLAENAWAMLDRLLAWSPEARPAAKDALQSELFCASFPALPTTLSRSLNFAARHDS
jgi:serine/threonine protein kinase